VIAYDIGATSRFSNSGEHPAAGHVPANTDTHD